MKKLFLILVLTLPACGAWATCTVTPKRCVAGETCSEAYCTTKYTYYAASCQCTDYCDCEIFPAGFDSRTCKCKVGPVSGGQPACK